MLSLRQTALFSKGACRRTAAIKRQDGIFTFSSRLASGSASGRAAAREAHVSTAADGAQHAFRQRPTHLFPKTRRLKERNSS